MEWSLTCRWTASPRPSRLPSASEGSPDRRWDGPGTRQTETCPPGTAKQREQATGRRLATEKCRGEGADSCVRQLRVAASM